MTANKWILTLTVAWLSCFALSFGHTYLFEPSGDGFARAMAALGVWVLWQVAAMATAIAALVVRLVRKAELAAWARYVGPVPLILTLLLWLGVGIWLAIDLAHDFA